MLSIIKQIDAKLFYMLSEGESSDEGDSYSAFNIGYSYLRK
jgi:hypothetical protein